MATNNSTPLPFFALQPQDEALYDLIFGDRAEREAKAAEAAAAWAAWRP